MMSRTGCIVLLMMLLLTGSTRSSAQRLDQATGECSLSGLPIQFNPFIWKTDFCTHSVPIEEFASGGPPRDGIPPLEFPGYTTVAEAVDWLTPREPVILFEHNSDIRVYPIQILIWHEIVNETVGGLPIVVTFCPLCYSAIVFERPVIDGVALTFGTAGNLRNNGLVMWDRQTESWWQQFPGEALVGSLTGTTLNRQPVSIVSWKTITEYHPDAKVLSKNTGFDRPYGQNPYLAYDRPDYPLPELDQFVQPLLPAMDRVVGVEADENHFAYKLADVARAGALNHVIGQQPIVVFWRPGAVTAVDNPVLIDGRPIGETGVFSRMFGGHELVFDTLGDGTFRDRDTGTRWSVTGEGLSGPYRGRTLTPLVHYDIFWFVWSVFKPGAPLFESNDVVVR